MLLLVAALSSVSIADKAGKFNKFGGCVPCHNPAVSPLVVVSVTGLPVVYTPGIVYRLNITITGGPAPYVNGANAAGGFCMRASAGDLAVPPGSTSVWVNQPQQTQATHTDSGSHQRSWEVDWHAPLLGEGPVDFDITAMAVDGDGVDDTDDEWGYAYIQSLEGVVLLDPTVAVTYPNGGEDLTGLTPHDVTFDLNDPDNTNDELLVWVNHSLDGGVGFSPIAGAQGIAGTPNPNSVQWVLPGVNSTQARIKIDVKDPDSLGATDMSDGNFEIDTAPPSIDSSSPTGTEVVITTDVRVDFNESMNTPSAEAAFSLKDTATWTLVTGTLGFLLNTMIFTPDSNLQLGTEYMANVTTGAMDDSDTGNRLLSLYSWTFTTASGGDMELPTISDVTAEPSPQEYPGNMNISANVQDNVLVHSVWVNVTYPGAAGYFEDFMGYDVSNDRYYLESSYPLLGTYDFTIFANDTNSNLNSSSGHSFDIEDTTPPTIAHVPVSIALADTTINITANVVDSYALAPTNPVWLNYTNVTGSPTNVTMTSAGGGDYWNETPAQIIEGTLTYFVWATDEQGNEIMTAVFTIQIVTTDIFPPEILNVQALPSPQETYGDVNITATVRDLSGLLSVWVVVTQSGTEIYNTTMSEGLNDLYYMEDQYDIVGTHDFTIWAEDTNNVVNSSSDTFEIVDTTPPAAPTGLSVSAGDDAGTLDIAWDANTELDLAGYDLYRSDTGANLTFTKVNTARITGTSYTDDGLEDNTTYYYMLKAVDDEGLESEFSHPADGTTITPGAEEEVDYMWLYALLAILIILVIVLAVASAMRKKPPAEEEEEELEELDEVGEEYSAEEGEEAAEEEMEKVY
ncbi:MAG: choice-of-anchor V domain-containing protein [Thermoplasmata archaeon]